MMDTNSKEDIVKVYEIGYLLISSIPEEKVLDTVTHLKEILSKKGAKMIADEAATLRPLAYTMTKKIGTQNHRFDEGYFGWVKFELETGEIEGIKKAFESHPSMLRTLLITTVKENTYLGKKDITPLIKSEEIVAGEKDATIPPAQASLEEMDKSIDEMVKGA